VLKVVEEKAQRGECDCKRMLSCDDALFAASSAKKFRESEWTGSLAEMKSLTFALRANAAQVALER
jgi:hypothetical protein